MRERERECVCERERLRERERERERLDAYTVGTATISTDLIRSI